MINVPAKPDIDIHSNCSTCCLYTAAQWADTTCLMDLSTYLAPTPQFSYILMSPNHGCLIVFYRINLSNSIHQNLLVWSGASGQTNTVLVLFLGCPTQLSAESPR